MEEEEEDEGEEAKKRERERDFQIIGHTGKSSFFSQLS